MYINIYVLICKHIHSPGAGAEHGNAPGGRGPWGGAVPRVQVATKEQVVKVSPGVAWCKVN